MNIIISQLHTSKNVLFGIWNAILILKNNSVGGNQSECVENENMHIKF